jgi:hypothetical protein
MKATASAGRVALLSETIVAMDYFPWRRDEDTPWCRWSTRDGCDCTVVPTRTTDEIERGVDATLAAIVEALEIICLGVPFVTEQLDELRRRAVELDASGEAIPTSFLARWRKQRLHPLAENAWAILRHADQIDVDLRAIDGLVEAARPARPTTSEIPVPATGIVYLIGAPGSLKIGFTVNVRSRFDGLRTSSPLDLSVLALLEGSRQLERELHRRFAVHRLRGEWFLDVPEIRDFFARDYRRIELQPD